MANLTVRFADNEVIEGTADDFSLESPDFHLKVARGTGNNEAALVPLPAVKKIRLDSGPADEHAAAADKKVAIRLQDGEVVRGYLNGSLEQHKYGLSLTLYSRDKQTMDTLAIPYTALKALFFVKTWDSRPPGFQAPGNVDAPLTQLLGDIREVTRLYRSGKLTRPEFLSQRKALLDRI
ncbi:MAG: hypothetical protein WAT58_12955 [Candidatus Dormiibacterota bacterium]